MTPPQTSIVLRDEPFSAVLARVAYRLIQLDFTRYPDRYTCPSSGMLALSRSLHASGFRALSTWVCAYAHAVACGKSTAYYKQWVVMRSRWGALNRRCGKPWAAVPSR